VSDITFTTPPGWPGIPARWTSSAKNGVGTALGASSHVWFTVSHGILDEIYYPRVDCACTRDLGLIVTDGESYFSEEKRDARSEVSLLAAGVPAFRVRNAATDGRYRIEKEILADPNGDVVLQRVRFEALVGEATDYRLFALLAPHLNNRGDGNTAWVGDYKGSPMLFAERNGYALALACSVPWLARSVGFVGFSDGWQELRDHGRLRQLYERAENGNVAVTGEIDFSGPAEVILALGFGSTPAAAGQHARASLFRGFDQARAEYLDGWNSWHRSRTKSAGHDSAHPMVDFSAALLRVHESKHFRGGVIASLSIPWGFSKGDDDLGGYHLVWPRDLAETATGFLASGAHSDARRVLNFLRVTQDADGHWCQNMWLDGSPYWVGIQMDEVALPVLLVDLAARCGALRPGEREQYWPMIEGAVAYLVRNGPVSPQDRWEEDSGYSPFTLAAEIAALIVAADDADRNGKPDLATYLRETADAWNASLEDWTYVTDTSLAGTCGVPGYYVRVAEPDQADAASPKHGFVPIKNRPPGESSASAELMVSPDALALVRFGLRAADDPRVVSTVKVIDAMLKVDTPNGPSWRRYNGDGYGEHPDGRPFDGTGTGRAWPLLTGERGHYELAAGRPDVAAALAAAMEAFAGTGQLLPEQIWDAPDIPERELFRGSASGSAQPLVWAHAEYLKLRRSIREGRVFDQPPQTVARYVSRGTRTTPYAIWRFNQKIRTMAAGRILRVEALARATIVWGVDGWQHVQELEAVEVGLGVRVADLATTSLSAGSCVDFTFFWVDGGRWEQTDFRVVVT
jgi:glucoamylase